MKKTITYDVENETMHKEINYIPFRYILAVLIAILEVVAVIAILMILCVHVPYFYLAAWATEIGCVIRIIASDDNPDYKVPWLLVVLIVPVAGFMLYFLFYSRTLQKRFIRRLEALKKQGYQREDAEYFENLKSANLAAAAQAKMLCDIAGTHIFTNTKQEYFPLGEDMHRRLLEDLEKAEKFIYMEYFIIEAVSYTHLTLPTMAVV